jgi:hypothetical protein
MRGFAFVLLMALAGCAVHVPEPDALMAGGDEASLPGLREGRRLYIDKCSGCHALKPVERYSDAEWTAEVDEMLRLKKVKLAAAERGRLLRYLTAANARE